MAHAAAHLKKARELEQCSEYKALQEAREKRRQQRQRAERKRQVKVVKNSLIQTTFFFFSSYATCIDTYLFTNWSQIQLYSSCVWWNFHISFIVYLSQKTVIIAFRFIVLLQICYSRTCVRARPWEFLEGTADALSSPTQAQLSCPPPWTPRAAGGGH